jgi:cytochrome c553
MPSRWPQRAWHWLRCAWQRIVGRSWRLAVLRVVLVLVALGVGGLLFVSAGLVPIAASEGHWPITRMFLHYAMRRSVDANTLGLEAPPLDDPALVLRGAGHYATGCESCHGAPGRPQPPLAQAMLPPPPALSSGSAMAPDELFWVIKHGIKYTAMPAWVAQQRDDEVWSMVAFVQRLPQLDAAGYFALAHGETAGRDPDSGPSQLGTPRPPGLAYCVRCHGTDGGGRGAFPQLAGQSEAYLRASLRAYARGERHSGMMQPAAAGLDATRIDRLARHFATLPAPATPAQPAATADVIRGRLLARRGDPARRIPSCVECHGPGNATRNPLYPDLAGQRADYLSLQLQLFKAGQRGGTGFAPVMRAIAERLEQADMRDLSAYYASLRSR